MFSLILIYFEIILLKLVTGSYLEFNEMKKKKTIKMNSSEQNK